MSPVLTSRWRCLGWPVDTMCFFGQSFSFFFFFPFSLSFSFFFFFTFSLSFLFLFFVFFFWQRISKETNWFPLFKTLLIVCSKLCHKKRKEKKKEKKQKKRKEKKQKKKLKRKKLRGRFSPTDPLCTAALHCSQSCLPFGVIVQPIQSTQSIMVGPTQSCLLVLIHSALLLTDPPNSLHSLP